MLSITRAKSMRNRKGGCQCRFLEYLAIDRWLNRKKSAGVTTWSSKTDETLFGDDKNAAARCHRLATAAVASPMLTICVQVANR